MIVNNNFIFFETSLNRSNRNGNYECRELNRFHLLIILFIVKHNRKLNKRFMKKN